MYSKRRKIYSVIFTIFTTKGYNPWHLNQDPGSLFLPHSVRWKPYSSGPQLRIQGSQLTQFPVGELQFLGGGGGRTSTFLILPPVHTADAKFRTSAAERSWVYPFSAQSKDRDSTWVWNHPRGSLQRACSLLAEGNQEDLKLLSLAHLALSTACEGGTPRLQLQGHGSEILPGWRSWP